MNFWSGSMTQYSGMPASAVLLDLRDEIAAPVLGVSADDFHDEVGAVPVVNPLPLGPLGVHVNDVRLTEAAMASMPYADAHA